MLNIFGNILMASFWGSILTIAFLFINSLFKKRISVSWHYFLWVIVLIRFLSPAFIAVDGKPNEISAFSFNKVENNIATNINNESKTIEMESQTISEPTLVEDDTYEPIQVKSSVNTVNKGININMIGIIWVSISVMILIYKCNSYFVYIKRMGKSNIEPNESEVNIFNLKKEQFNIKGKVKLYKNDFAGSPFAIGLFKPLVILPNKTYSDIQLKHILSHELNHIKRRDIVLKWFYEIAKAVHWFNPFIYIATKTSSFYCEASCDANVLKISSVDERKEYGLTILELISHTITSKNQMCVSIANNKSDLKKRILLIKNYGQNKRNIILTGIMSILIFMFSACSSIKYEESLNKALLPLGELNQLSLSKEENSDTENLLNNKINILVLGMDGDGLDSRADVIMIVSICGEETEINVISMPRDLTVSLSDEIKSELVSRKIDFNDDMKLGRLTNYFSNKDDIKYIQSEISNLFNIDTDYYIKIEMQGFKKIVDIFGGVDMVIPEGGLYYSDPSQGLEIALNEGEQHLDGEKALGLIRYRNTYKNGDLDRIDVQHYLLTNLINQNLYEGNLSNNLISALPVVLENIETDITLDMFKSFIQFIPKDYIGKLIFSTYGEDSISSEPVLLESININEYNGEKLQWPLAGYSKISSAYGKRILPIGNTEDFHTGIDIPAPLGQKVVAVSDGVVIKSEFADNISGNKIIIDHGNGLSTSYSHNSTLIAKVGDKVIRGQEIAKVGSTGMSTGNHLHFEVILDEEFQNPLDYLILE